MAEPRRFANIGHTHDVVGGYGLSASGNRWGVLTPVLDDGVLEVGKFIDFHETDADTDDYDYRLACVSGRLQGNSGVLFGPGEFQAASGALPTLGNHNNSTALSIRYASDATYGLSAGVLSATGEGWIQVHRADGTATAYSLKLQPLGGAVDISGTYLAGNELSNLDDAAVSSYNALRIDRYSSTATNQAAVLNNANSVLTYNHHTGGYAWQLAHSDGATALYTRNQSAGTWSSWRRVATHTSATGPINGDAADTWSTSSWSRCIRLAANSSGNSIQFYDSTKHWGIGSAGGLFYVMNTTTDTSSGAGMSYPFYNDGTYWNFANPVIFSGVSASLSSGYYLYLNGYGSSEYLTYNTGTSYTTLMVAGSKGGYSGFVMPAAYGYPAFMFSTATTGEFGIYYATGAGWRLYYRYDNDCWAMGGTTTSASYRLYVTGSSYATGSWATSDARKKTDVLTIDDALDKVCSMRGVSYKWREDAGVGQDPTIPHIGVIAQEIEAVVPEAVQYAEDADSYAVDYNGLVGLLIQAVKELKEEVNVLKNAGR